MKPTLLARSFKLKTRTSFVKLTRPNAIAALGKAKSSLTTQLEDTKRLGDSEARDRAALLSKFKAVNSELGNLRERIEEESEKKSDALKALSKAQAEIQLWKSKFETEGMGRVDDLEGGKQKLSAALTEAEETIDSLNQKVATTERPNIVLRLSLKTFNLNMRESMLQLLLQKNVAGTLTRLLVNGKPK